MNRVVRAKEFQSWIVIVIATLAGLAITALPAVGAHSEEGTYSLSGCYWAANSSVGDRSDVYVYADPVGESSEVFVCALMPGMAPGKGEVLSDDGVLARSGGLELMLAAVGALALGVGVFLRRRAARLQRARA